ncbi:hypothetical protein F5Y07DRAFT_396067 [Xylaria sp. FL0933]|nr:hypothetical protein F5Y07DRAFT_396067 [Xylaria sp. FL0933]
MSCEKLRYEAWKALTIRGAIAITTSLSTAACFPMRLEQREIAASGGVLQPDVAKLRKWNWHRRETWRFGWVEERDGSLDNLTPGGYEWINQEIFKKWMGEGVVRTVMRVMNGPSTLNPLNGSKRL